MQTSILRDLTPAWFTHQAPDIQLFIWRRCLTPALRLELWRGLGTETKAQLLLALIVPSGQERLTIRVD